MEKKKIVIILLTIFIITGAVFSFNTYMNQRFNTRAADQIFISSLSEAATGFAVDVFCNRFL